MDTVCTAPLLRSCLLLAAGCAGNLYAQAGFETEVRPVLAKNCQACHNGKTRSSGLDLTSRAALAEGGNRGPGFDWLLKAVRQEGDLKMPPGGKLKPQEIAALERWISAGANWPGSTASAKRTATDHWAFQPVKRLQPPETANRNWPRGAIDRFILSRLERERIAPSPEADKLTLLRRVHLDLTGLPPTPAEIGQFRNDPSPTAYESAVDRLLASPHYGERWARHWLDQARYADSDGGSRDEPRQIWKYRDWVVEALNRDMPFDQFVIEQLAGDLLPQATESQMIATGFNRNSLLQIEAGTDREQYRVDAVADRVDTTGTVLLGLSTGCARCHDHKFDPISQREYYQFFSYFNNIDEYGPDLPAHAITGDLGVTHGPLLVSGKKEDVERYNALRSQLLALYRERIQYRGGEEGPGGPGDKVRVETINTLKKQLPPVTLAMIMRERGTPRPAHVLLGGDYLRKGIEVRPGVLSALHPPEGSVATRLDLARWIATGRNPLFARVAVNRIWQQYFGLGLVETENDFGKQGALPTHPELLDWLASEFARGGWSRKALHRMIVTSAVYRQSSARRKDLEMRDPRNQLLARQSRLRLDAEIVRDSALTVSGLLSTKLGGASVFPPQPEGVMETGQVKQSWKTSTGEDRCRRGFYTFRYRVTPNPSMHVFDAAGGLLPCTRRARSNTPLQALTLLNDPNFHEMAQALGRRIAASSEPLANAFLLTLGRPPTVAEGERVRRLYAVELDAFRTKETEAVELAGTDATPETAAWTAIARVLINTDEFITRE